MIRALPICLALLAGCATPSEQNDTDRQVRAACRAEADRVLQRRDRGDLARLDEQEARTGVGSLGSQQLQTERLGLTWQRDRLAADCERGLLNPSPQPVVARP